MATTRKDLEEIAGRIRDAQISGVITKSDANVFVNILEPALGRTTGLNVNGNRKFDADRFRRAAILESEDNRD